MKMKVLFYSSVATKDLFDTQLFYKIDITILEKLGYEVVLSNRIADAFCFWKYNFTFIYFYRYGFFVALIAKLFFKRNYFTGGIDYLDEKYASKYAYRLQKIFFKLCHILSDCSILVSKSDVENVKKIYHGRMPSRTELVFHAIEVSKYICPDDMVKNEYFTTIAWMGNKENVIRKGIDLSLELFKYLKMNFEKYSICKFYIIGKEGEGTEYLRKECSQLELDNWVVFTGAINEEEKIKYLCHGKYYLQLSQYEGYGMAALEALAARNIVIHSGRGGLKDVVGKYGIELDIDQNSENCFKELHCDIENFDKELLTLGKSYVIQNFSYNVRENRLKKILYNLK